MWSLLPLCLVLAGTFAIPPPINLRSGKPPLKSEEDYLTLARNITHDYRATAATLKYKYVLEGGRIVNSKPSSPYVEVAATLAVTEQGHYEAALVISREIMHSPSEIFNNLYHHRARVGVFAHSEVLSVFPEFLHLADRPECRGKCSGACSSTCTFDGRKWDKTAGAGGIRAVCDVSNVICDSQDPYRHHDNILLHEFAHTINNYGMSSSLKRQVVNAYNNAKRNQIWDMRAYAMANSQEFWAEASGAFFNGEHQVSSNGHMNLCGSQFCRTEQQTRNHIKAKDPELFKILSYVYTNNRPDLPGNIGDCIH